MNKELALVPSKEEFEIIQTIAKCAVESKYFDKLGGNAGIMCIALYAREMGIPIMSAIMGGLQNVMGKITMSPELMNSLIRQNGHKIEILHLNGRECKIKGTRKDTNESYVASFTLEDAKKAKLVKEGGGYDKYAEDMLFARCISRLRRRLFPDVASRSYVTGELDAAEDDKHDSKPSKEVIDIQTEERVTEPVEVEAERPEEPGMGIREDMVLMDLIGDDIEYRNRIYSHYSKDLKKEVKTFLDIPLKEYNPILDRVKKYKASLQTPQLQET